MLQRVGHCRSLFVVSTCRRKEQSQQQAVLGRLSTQRLGSDGGPIKMPFSHHLCYAPCWPWCLTRGYKDGWEQPGHPRFKFCSLLQNMKPCPAQPCLRPCREQLGLPMVSVLLAERGTMPSPTWPPTLVGTCGQKEQCQLQA